MTEVLVAVLLTSIIGMAVVVSFFTGTRTYMSNTSRNITTGELAVAFDSMTQTLKSSYKDAGTNNTLVMPWIWLATTAHPDGQQAVNSGMESTFYATIPNQGLVIVHWYVGEGKLWQETIACGSICGRTDDYTSIAPSNRRALISNLMVPTYGQRPLFSWYGATSPTPLNDPDPAIQLGWVEGVVAVHLSLSVWQGSGNNPSTVENTIMLPGNLANYGGRATWSAAPVVSGAVPTATQPSTTPPPPTTTVEPPPPSSAPTSPPAEPTTISSTTTTDDLPSTQPPPPGGDGGTSVYDPPPPPPTDTSSSTPTPPSDPTSLPAPPSNTILFSPPDGFV